MRIGSGHSGTNKKQQTSKDNCYQNQNNQLKRLHQQRLLRQQKQINKNAIQSTSSKGLQSISHQSSVLQKQGSSHRENKSSCPSNLFLNSLLSDPRSIQQKPNSISLSSLFQQNPRTFCIKPSPNIKSILMTTYGYVMDVLGPIAQTGVPFVLLNDTKENGPGRLERNFQGFSNMTLVIPPRTNKGYGVFHTKIWLIRFVSFLRVVVCTGNQHAEDWIIWLNAYWYQDFPYKAMKISDYDQKKQQQKVEHKNEQKSKPTKQSTKQYKKQIKQFANVISLDDDSQEQPIKQKPSDFNYSKDFKQTLSLVLKNMFPADFSLQKELGINLDKYDFSDVKVVLIPSIPGRHSIKDGQMLKYGMCKVKKVIKQMCPKLKSGSLTYNSSSLGIIDQSFLSQLYFSFVPHATLFSPTNYRLIYPSYKYITEQTCGQSQVLFLKKENYYKSDRKDVFYLYQPSNKNNVKGAIPHLKTILVEAYEDKQGSKDIKDSKTCIFYMGSHNMTKAAWGTYQKNDTQISFSNSELGLLFLEMKKQQLMNWLPYNYPPRKYKQYDKPFMQ